MSSNWLYATWYLYCFSFLKTLNIRKHREIMSVHNVRCLCNSNSQGITSFDFFHPGNTAWVMTLIFSWWRGDNNSLEKGRCCPQSPSGGGSMEVTLMLTLPTVPHYLRTPIFIWLPISPPSEKYPQAQILDDLPCIWPMVRSLSNLSTPGTKQENLWVTP